MMTSSAPADDLDEDDITTDLFDMDMGGDDYDMDDISSQLSDVGILQDGK